MKHESFRRYIETIDDNLMAIIVVCLCFSCLANNCTSCVVDTACVIFNSAQECNEDSTIIKEETNPKDQKKEIEGDRSSE